VEALRAFLRSEGGGVGAAASGQTVQNLKKLGLIDADASVVGSAIREGTGVITRDKKILKKVPGVAGEF